MMRISVLLMFASAAACFGADAAAGKTVFDAKCKTCHLADGSGNKGIAKIFGVEIKPMESADFQKLSDEDMKTTITMGTGKMKPVAGVTGADLDNLIAYVRSMRK